MCWLSINITWKSFLIFLVFLILIHLAYTCINMLMPDMSRSYSLLNCSFKADSSLTKWANYNIIIIEVRNSFEITLTIMIIRSSMITTKNWGTKLTFKREKVLLLTKLNWAVISEMSELHVKDKRVIINYQSSLFLNFWTCYL